MRRRPPTWDGDQLELTEFGGLGHQAGLTGSVAPSWRAGMAVPRTEGSFDQEFKEWDRRYCRYPLLQRR